MKVLLRVSFVCAGIVLAAIAVATTSGVPTVAATPVPTSTPTEIPGVQSLFPATPHPAPTPPTPPRVGIEGVWEIAIQQGSTTTYTHLQLKQRQNALTGTYLDSGKNASPAIGTVDGGSVRIIVTLKDGSEIVFQGQLDGTTDMVGMMTTPTQEVPFTADYRPKENFFDNLNENPTGITNGLTTPPPE